MQKKITDTDGKDKPHPELMAVGSAEAMRALQALANTDSDNHSVSFESAYEVLRRLIKQRPDPGLVTELVAALGMWMVEFDTAALVESDHRQASMAEAWRATYAALAKAKALGK